MRARSFVRLPPFTAGMRIGLFGGSFNPPHAGHALVSEIAMRRLRLDRVWWLVTPGNPLKKNCDLPALEQRIIAARKLTRDPRIVVSGIEAHLGTRYTYDTIRYLAARTPGVRFVWIMGADNLAQFDRWQHWAEIAALMPIAIVDRPGATFSALGARAAQRLAPWRLDEARACNLALQRAPRFVFLHDRRINLSSSVLRAQAAHAQ